MSRGVWCIAEIGGITDTEDTYLAPDTPASHLIRGHNVWHDHHGCCWGFENWLELHFNEQLAGANGLRQSRQVCAVDTLTVPGIGDLTYFYLKHKLDLGDKIIFAVTKWPGIANHGSDQVLWLCSVVRSVFVQPIANYPLLIAENSYKISERSQLWNSDRFFANNNKLIGSCWLSRNGRKIIPVWQSQENIYKAFLIIIAISWFPRFPRSVCYQLLVSDKYISVSIPVTLFNVCWAPYLTIVRR